MTRNLAVIVCGIALVASAVAQQPTQPNPGQKSAPPDAGAAVVDAGAPPAPSRGQLREQALELRRLLEEAREAEASEPK